LCPPLQSINQSINQSVNQLINKSCQTQLKTAKILAMYTQYKIAKRSSPTKFYGQ